MFVGFGLWKLIGLCLDGWAHRHQPELETFFTPWHAVFYTGFVGAASWLAFMIIRRRPHARDLRSAIPDGYGLAVVGLAIFAAGGIGDGFWHTIFGVETSLDALLSPTHLVMLLGTLAGTTAPIRSAWRDPSSPRAPAGLGDVLPVVLSLALATTAVAFFFLYANGFNNWPMQLRYVPGIDEETAALGILAIIVSTVVLVGPILLLLRRWTPPPGTFTVLFGVVGAFLAGLDAFAHWWQVLAPLAGGAIADAVMTTAALDRGTLAATQRARALAAGLAVPVALWTVSAVTTHLAWEIRWPPDLWLGSITMAVLTGGALALVAYPPGVPASAAD